MRFIFNISFAYRRIDGVEWEEYHSPSLIMSQ